jgi:uncharacterized membrane protein YvbJ
MNYCPNCGEERNDSAQICEFCGFSFNIMDDLEEKNRKINQLEQELHQLESNSNIATKAIIADNSPLKYFWIIASLMIIGFFSFIFYFIYMASN